MFLLAESLCGVSPASKHQIPGGPSAFSKNPSDQCPVLKGDNFGRLDIVTCSFLLISSL